MDPSQASQEWPPSAVYLRGVKKSKTRYLSVNRFAIVRNVKQRGPRVPPLRVSTGRYGRPKHYYNPENPMPWGARVWLEFDA